jgi:hypothetical protein
MVQTETTRAAETAETTAGHRGRRWRAVAGSPVLWALVGSLALAALFDWKVLAHLTTGIVGGRSDGYENLWNDWWVRTALLRLHRNPFFSSWIEYPTGASLRFHTLNPLAGLIALPLAPLVGSIGALNLKLVFALVGSTFFAWLLMRDLTGSPLAAFVGAAAFTYANDQVILGTQKGTENYLMGTALLPLFCWLLTRAVTRDRWHGYAVAAIAALLALALTDWQYTLFAVLITAVTFVVTALARRERHAVGALLVRVGVVGGVWAVLVLPTLVLPMLREARRAPWLELSQEQASAHAKALAQFVRPGFENPGYPLLIVIGVGLALLWRRDDARQDRLPVVLWGLIAAVGFVLSLGPKLLLTPDHETRIPLPFAAFARLPLVSSSRKPFLYYSALGMLGVGVLLAFALREWAPLVRRLAGRLRDGGLTPRVVQAVSGAAVALLLIGTLLPAYRVAREGDFIPPDWPAFYRDIVAHDPDDYAILETPLFVGQRGRSDAVYAAFQTVYHKPRFGSSIARDHKADNPDLFVRRATLFRDFFYLDKVAYTDLYRPSKAPDFLATPDLRVVGLPLLNFYKVRYIVLYLDALRETGSGATGTARTLVRAALGDGAQPVYTDAEMEVYRVPDAPPPARPVFLDTGTNGWWPPEKTPQGVPYRWADTRDGKAAELLLFNLGTAARKVRVQFTLFNYQVDRGVSVAMDGNRVRDVALAANAGQDVSLDLDVSPGMHLLTLSSPQPPIPIPNNGGKDNRLLSFGVRAIQVQEIAG